jgi:hypothetical protein
VIEARLRGAGFRRCRIKGSGEDSWTRGGQLFTERAALRLV